MNLQNTIINERMRKMEITDVRIRKVSREGDMKAVATVNFEGVFAVHDIKIIDGKNGLFIAMPSRKGNDRKFRDIAHPLNSEFRSYMQEVILEKYLEDISEEK